MKKVILPLAIVAMLAGACTKENIGSLDSSVANSSKGADDRGFDDRGGKVGGGGGRNISASRVPAAVMSVHKKRYPSATRAEWKKLNNGNYKVEFFFSGKKIQSVYSPAGKLLKEERA